MSHNNSDTENASTHLRRLATRFYKRLTGKPLILDDISVIQLTGDDKTLYEARRDPHGRWTIYRMFKVSYDRKSQRVHETLRGGLTVGEALNALRTFCPTGMARHSSHYNHPRQVAQLLRQRPAPE